MVKRLQSHDLHQRVCRENAPWMCAYVAALSIARCQPVSALQSMLSVVYAIRYPSDFRFIPGFEFGVRRLLSASPRLSVSEKNMPKKTTF